jgi:hypothetical protein
LSGGKFLRVSLLGFDFACGLPAGCGEFFQGTILEDRSIICWALVEFIEEDGAVRTEVRGVEQESTQLVIVGDLIQTDKMAERGVDRNEYFLGYDDPESHKESDYWIEQANARLKR